MTAEHEEKRSTAKLAKRAKTDNRPQSSQSSQRAIADDIGQQSRGSGSFALAGPKLTEGT